MWFHVIISNTNNLCSSIFWTIYLNINYVPTCLVCLILIVFVMGDRWPYSRCLVRCCLQDLFNTARRTRHGWDYWRSRDELISDVLLWTASHGRAKAGRPARTYIQQLCANSPEDLPKAMDDRGGVAKESQEYQCW